METIARTRMRLGLSQRALARRAGVSFKGLQLMETRDHDARLSSLRKVAAGLGLPATGIDAVVARFLSGEGESVESASLRVVEDGLDSWTVHLFDFVDAFRTRPRPSLVDRAPVAELEPGVRALMASSVEALCDEAGLPRPPWCAAVPPLEDPWFVSGVENLKAAALVESPATFRKRNLFVLENFLARA